MRCIVPYNLYILVLNTQLFDVGEILRTEAKKKKRDSVGSKIMGSVLEYKTDVGRKRKMAKKK